MRPPTRLAICGAFIIMAVPLACGGPQSPDTPDAGAPAEEEGPPPPPEGWTCEDRWWGEGWCDCGCGVIDELDCPEDVATEIESCVYSACEGDQRPDPWDTVSCQFNFWSCNPDHNLAEQLPRRYPPPPPPKESKPPRMP